MRRLDEADVVVASGGGEREVVLAGDEPIERHGHVRDVSRLTTEVDRTELMPVESDRHPVIEVVVDALQDELDLGAAALGVEIGDG